MKKWRKKREKKVQKERKYKQKRTNKGDQDSLTGKKKNFEISTKNGVKLQNFHLSF